MIKRLLLTVLIVMMLLQTGCWNRTELEDLGLVMMTAIDKNDTGEFEGYFIVIKPSLLRSQGGEASERASIVIKGKGRTIFDAIRATLLETPRKLFFGQQIVVVITEKVAREVDIGDVLDIMLRDHEFRRSVKLLITPNKAEEAISAQPEIENLVAKEISSIVEQSKSSAFFPNVNINDFTKVLASEVPNPVAPLLIIKEGIMQRKFFEEPSKQAPLVPFVEGAAVFEGERLVGTIDRITTRGYLFIKDKIQSTIYVVPSVGIEQKPVSMEITSNKTKIEVDMADDMPSINIKVKTEANIGEEMSETNYTKEENLKALEKVTARAIEEDIQKAIDKAQLDLRVDFFGLGEDVHRKYKEYWKEHKNQWGNIFPDLKITYDVEVKIRRMGLQTQPLEVE